MPINPNRLSSRDLWRQIWRGSRTLTGPSYLTGATGGGIFKTVDGGINWIPIFGCQVKPGSVAAIACPDSDTNIV